MNEWLRPPLGKKRRVLRDSVLRDQDYWYVGLSQLKSLAVSASRPN